MGAVKRRILVRKGVTDLLATVYLSIITLARDFTPCSGADSWSMVLGAGPSWWVWDSGRAILFYPAEYP